MKTQDEKTTLIPAQKLPPTWQLSTIGDLLKIRNGFAFKSKDYLESGALLIRQANLGGSRVNNEKAKYLPKSYLEEYNAFLVKKGDILIGMSGSIGKLCTYDRNEPALQNQRTGLLLFKDPELKPWVWHYLPLLEKELVKVGKGIAVQNISAAQIESFPIPVAPLEQQKHIVAEIEKQFSRLDEAVANLKRIKANLKRYKAAVLKAAVEGKLTEDWRKEHLPAPMSRPGKFYTYAILCADDSIYVGHTDDIERRWNEHREGKGAEWTKDHKPVKIAHFEEFDSRQEAADREKWLKTGFGRKWIKRELAAGRTRQAGHVEPASKLLERILTERRAQWKGKGKYKEPSTSELTNLPSLPKDWTWASVDQIAEVLLGKMLDKNKHQSGKRLPYLRNINVRWGRIETEDLLEMFFKDDQLARYGLEPGDVLVCEGGEPGRASVWNGKVPGLKYQKALHRVRFYGETEPRYLVILLEYLANTGRLDRWFTGSTIKHFTRESFISLPIPIPPFAEQKHIVAEVERHLSVIEELETTVEANLTRADRLRQSVLKKGFSGELVGVL